jgi:hypothetical protein
MQRIVKNTVVAGLIRRFMAIYPLDNFLDNLLMLYHPRRTPAKIPAPTASSTSAAIAVVGIVTLANV